MRKNVEDGEWRLDNGGKKRRVYMYIVCLSCTLFVVLRYIRV